MKKHVLVVDDEEAVCWTLNRALTGEGYSVAIAASAEEAFVSVASKCPNAIILDVRLPGMDGLSALQTLDENSNHAPIIIITAHGNLKTTVQAVEKGAFDCLGKPFDLEQALDVVGRAIRAGETKNYQKGDPSAAAEMTAPPDEFVGRSPAMHAVFKRIAMVAPHQSCVLITGESGTGKELVARALHRFSARRDKPFLPVNIAALNPSIVESELFGHVKGAFTGADQTRPGILQLANEGTIFIDELADIPMHVQVKLLRALEHGEMLPVGTSQPQAISVRILAATNQDLNAKIVDGSFRHDLYFRLNVFQIHLPALRERRDDIALLAEFFLSKLARHALPLSADTRQFLESQSWPGNVRELRNALEHAIIVARGGQLLPEHFPVVRTSLSPTAAADHLANAVRRWVHEQYVCGKDDTRGNLHEMLLRAVEPALLEEVLARVGGNRHLTAAMLGLNRATVRKKLKHYHLPNADETGGDQVP